jgi:hypothetical protein
MPLDGLRAWIGEVERKLGMRTRVFLVLAAIAIGGAGAAIYLALDTRDNAVSESDVRALQEDLEAQIVGGGTASGTGLTELEADLRALEAQVDASGGDSDGAGADSGGKVPPGTSGTVPGTGDATGGIATGSNEAREQGELLDEAEQRDGAAEATGGKSNAGG